MMKELFARFLYYYDTVVSVLGEVIGRVVGFCFGSLFGLFLFSLYQGFLKGYLQAGVSHKETFQYLYYKDKAKETKKNKSE